MLRTSSLDKRKYLRQAVEKAMKPVNDYWKESNLRPFMIAVSDKEIPVFAIDHLLRRDISWVFNGLEDNTIRCGKQPKLLAAIILFVG